MSGLRKTQKMYWEVTDDDTIFDSSGHTRSDRDSAQEFKDSCADDSLSKSQGARGD